MNHYKLISVIGILPILIGLLVPSSTLINFLRGTPPINLQDKLLLGAMLFKISLIILGLYVTIISMFPVWKTIGYREKLFPDNRSKSVPVILSLILFVSFALRIYNLNSGLWYDEILTYVNYANRSFGEIFTTYDSQNQHPLFSLLAHLSFQMFGGSPWALRFPAVLFGVCSILALYLLGREVSTPREALLSSALLAFSYQHIWFSQNGRGYTGILFWTLLTSWLLLRGLREGLPRLWIMYALSSALGIYTHMTMFFVVAGHFTIYLMMLWLRRKEVWPEKWAGFFLGFCLTGLFTLLLHALILPQIFTGTALSEGTTSTVAAWKNPLWTVFEFVKGIKIGFTGTIAVIVVLSIFGAGFLNFMRKNYVLILLLVIPALGGIAVVKAMGHPLWPRFFFFTMGFGALIVVRGTMVWGYIIDRLFHFRPAKSVAVGTILCTGLILVLAISAPSAYGPKQDYMGALNFVESKKEVGDAVVTVGITATFPYRHFYKMNWESVETLESLNAVRLRTKRTWLLYTMPLYIESAHPEIMASIQRDFKVVEQFYGTLSGGTIFVCRSDSPPSQSM